MLVIRMQRTGRKGHAMFRVVVQDSRRTPTSGKIVASLGHYDPHAKAVTLNQERVEFYLAHGAQPSERLVRLFKAQGIKLPKWVQKAQDKKREVRNPDKRRSTRPPEPVAEKAPVPTEEASEAAPAAEAEEAVPTQETPATSENQPEEPAKETTDDNTES